MKLQIRKSVFETNSSSVHTLSIVPEFSKNIQFPKKLVFGKGPDLFSEFMKNRKDNEFYKDFPEYWKEDVYSSEIQEKADLVMKTILSSYSVGDYFTLKNQISKSLKKFGIECEFNEDYDHLVKYEFIGNGDSPDCFIIDLINGEAYDKDEKLVEDVLAKFLFESGSFFYEYCDDCGEYDGPEIPEANITFQERES